MTEVKTCSDELLPVFTIGTVESVKEVKDAFPKGSIWNLNVKISECKKNRVESPNAGQFYMLRSVKSSLLLGRPISIFHSEYNEKSDFASVRQTAADVWLELEKTLSFPKPSAGTADRSVWQFGKACGACELRSQRSCPAHC